MALTLLYGPRVAKPDEGAPIADGLTEGPPPPSGPIGVPSRIPGLIVGVFFGPGAGHFLAGLPRRAVVFALSGMALHILASIAVAGAPSVSTLALFALPLVVHIASLVDLARVPKERLQRARLATVGQVVALVIAGIFLRNGIRTGVLELFQLPSGSMIPTLLVGDYFFVSKLGPPARGDVITFPNPEQADQSFVKRVVGLPGETVSQRGGVISVNGEAIKRCTIGKLEGGGVLVLERLGEKIFFVQDDDKMPDDERTWTVKPGELFVIGDNRANSHDSRTWFAGKGGGVPLGSVGRATFRVFRQGALSFGAIDELVLPAGARGLADGFAKCRAELGG